MLPAKKFGVLVPGCSELQPCSLEEVGRYHVRLARPASGYVKDRRMYAPAAPGHAWGGAEVTLAQRPGASTARRPPTAQEHRAFIC